MHPRRVIPHIGIGRPRGIARLAIVSIVSVLAVPGVAGRASAAPLPTRACSSVRSVLTEASEGLLMPSESDSPFASFVWPGAARPPVTTADLLGLTGHAPDTPVEIVDLATFFRNVAQHQPWHDRRQAMEVRRFQRLVRTLERRLTDIRVYRVGTIRIDAYIVGSCGRDLAGLSTVLIET